MTQPKYAQVAESIRVQIADGTLTPGQPAPSGAALARATGYSTLTCRHALRTLIKNGLLVPGTSPNARPRVAGPATRHEQTLADAARMLSLSLAGHRRAASLTQPQLAALTDVSVTTIGHAETGRLWQSRGFWERADKELNAGGELLARHDLYRAATAAPPSSDGPDDTALGSAVPLGPVPVAAETVTVVVAPVASVTITWADGTATTVRPPHPSPRQATPQARD